MPDPALQEAIALAKQGQRKEAQALVSRLIKSDPNSADAWIVMAQIVDDNAKAIQCWEQVLRIRPGDQRAQQFLAKLRPTEDVFDPFFSEPAPTPAKPTASPTKSKVPRMAIGAATLLLCLVVGCVLSLAFVIPAAQTAMRATEAAIVTALMDFGTPVPTDSTPATPRITQEQDQPTVTRIPSRTPRATYTAGPTRPPTETPTPRPTRTPTATITPTAAPVTKQIGPILDTGRDEEYTIAATLNSWEMVSKIDYSEAKAGSVFLVVNVTVENKGPGSALTIGVYSFQALDGNGAVRDYHYAGLGLDCALESVDLRAGGSITGCIAFEVPQDGRLELIYAPYQYDSLEPGRYISFVIRQ